jgi:carbon starvation protein CstA
MKQRNVAAVLFLTLFTLGIYGIVWLVKTKNEMNKLGAQIPTAWLLIVPIANIWWTWKYSEGVEKVSGEKMSTVMSFILLYLLSVIGMMILQMEYNKIGAGGAVAATPAPQQAATYAQPAMQTPQVPPAPTDTPTVPPQVQPPTPPPAA